MRKLLTFVLLLLAGCVIRDPYAAPIGYLNDGLYCWHMNAEGKWEIEGLSHWCPPETRFGYVVDQPKNQR